MDKPLIVRFVSGVDPVPWLRTDNSPYECITLANPIDAMEAMRRQLPNLLIVCLQKPNDLAHLTEFRAAFPTLPVIVLSGFTSEEILLEALRLNVRDFLKVPVDPHLLVDKIQKILNGWLTAGGRPQSFQGGRARSPSPAPSHEIARAVNYLQSNFWRSDMSLDLVAQVVNMSLFHFSRTFKRLMGMNYSQYLTRLRVEQAKMLLCDSALSVTDVCMTVGYNDLTHFERVFKRLVGHSPSVFRRLYRSREITRLLEARKSREMSLVKQR